MRIVARNVREPFAEIDIIAMDNDTLCFIEVRTRRDATLGHPAETVSSAKQKSIRRAALAYLAKKNIRDIPVRFDVATIIWKNSELEYFEDAF